MSDGLERYQKLLGPSIETFSDPKFKPYVCTKPDGFSLQAIVALQNKIDLPGKLRFTDIHTTLVYSLTPLSTKLVQMSVSKTIKFAAKVDTIERFGPNKDVLVVTLKSKDMEKRNDYWKSIGATSTYDEYRPHITLADKPQDSDPTTSPEDWAMRMDNIAKDMEAYLKAMPELLFVGEYAEPIREKTK